MISLFSTSLVLLPYLSSIAQAASLSLSLNLTGQSFFDPWTFLNGPDSNNSGNALFQTQSQAVGAQLVGVNSAGNVFIKADNTTSGVGDPNFGRPSVRLFSNFTFNAGDLMVIDLLHIPYGCTVWPAYWTEGPNWPTNGEIDIIENVNLATNNQFSLHTTNGCTHPPASANVNETGNLMSTDCFNATNSNEGCIVQDPSSNSFGANFANNGGGAVATYIGPDGIKIWSFNRSSIPADLSTKNPNPDNWPAPTAFYPDTSCPTSTFFGPQNVVIDITMCGVFANAPGLYNSGGCPGDCQQAVLIPSNYDTAYFEIRSLTLFSTTNSSSNGNTSSSSAASGSSKTSGSVNSNGSPVTYSFMSSAVTIFLGVFLPVVCAFTTMVL